MSTEVRTARADLKYLDGEITEEQYVLAMSQLTAEEDLASDVESMKAEKYEELQEQFINDEISGEEMEEQMDPLFDSGDDFLDESVDDAPDDCRWAHWTARILSRFKGKI